MHFTHYILGKSNPVLDININNYFDRLCFKCIVVIYFDFKFYEMSVYVYLLVSSLSTSEGKRSGPRTTLCGFLLLFTKTIDTPLCSYSLFTVSPSGNVGALADRRPACDQAERWLIYTGTLHRIE